MHTPARGYHDSPSKSEIVFFPFVYQISEVQPVSFGHTLVYQRTKININFSLVFSTAAVVALLSTATAGEGELLAPCFMMPL